MKKEKWFWLMLLLLTGGLLMSGCDDVDDETGDEEELLDASRPNYMGDGSDELPQTNNLSGSTWKGVSDEYSLWVEFNKSDCLFTGYDYVARKDTTASYAYSFSWPQLTLTPKDDKGSVLTGTATKEWTKYTMTFTDSTDAAVWMQVEIRTSSAFR